MINNLLVSLGFDAVPFLSDKNYWLITYLLTGVWQSAGWGTILYLAALTGINKELFEAAEVDGAGRMETYSAYYYSWYQTDDCYTADHQFGKYDLHRL